MRQRWLMMRLIVGFLFALFMALALKSTGLAVMPVEGTDIVAQGDKLEHPKKRWAEGEILVKFKKHISTIARAEAYAKKGMEVIDEIKELDVQRVKGKKGETVEELLAKYTGDPDVEYAEPNYKVEATAIPNDPSFSLLYGLHNTGQTGGTDDADIDAPEAWDVTTGSQDIIVAVIDTGIDYNHPDLQANMWTNPGEIAGNGVDDDNNGFIDDIYGWDFIGSGDNDPYDDRYHGTHVAGTIGAIGNNGVGVAGVNWQVRLMALKFLNSGGSGYISDAVEAVLYAANMGARISNNSWGGGGYSQTFRDALITANQQGHLFVAAAGNSAANVDSGSFYPCAYEEPNMVCVGATDANDTLASFSNYGATSVHLSAPGKDIYSAVPGNSYVSKSGTSMATPHVAGIAALILSRQQSLNVQQLKSILLGATDSKDNLSPSPSNTTKTMTGGRLNAYSAATTSFTIEPEVFMVELSTPNNPSTSITLSLVSINGFSDTVSLSARAIGANSGLTTTLGMQVSPTAVYIPADGIASATLDISIGAAALNKYAVLIEGADASGKKAVAQLIVYVYEYKPDLVQTAVSGPEIVKIGQTITLTDTVKNEGNLSAEGFTVGLYLSRDTTVTTDDILLGSRTISSLAAGASSSANTTVTIPMDLSGTYYLGAIADPADIILESGDPSNNIRVSATPMEVNVTDPDLVPSSLSSPETGSRGRPITVSDTVYNAGGGKAGTFTVGFYLSTDTVITSSDTLLGARTVSSLSSGASNTASTTVTIPTGTPAGAYYLGVIVDAASAITEVNKENNTLSAGVTITQSDLMPTAISGPAKGLGGGTIAVTDTVYNGGAGEAGTFTVGFYLSADSTITTGDTFLGSRTVSSLAAGAADTASTNVTIPLEATGGTYYLGVIVDSTNAVPEDNEGNNTLASAATITITGPDIIPTEVSGPSSGAQGDSITINDTVYNTGEEDAVTSFGVAFYLSIDSTITTTDTWIGSRIVSGLASGASSTSATTLRIPVNVLPGTYYIGVIANPYGTLVEANKANNALVSTIPVTVKPYVGGLVLLTAATYDGTASVSGLTDIIAVAGGGWGGNYYYSGWHSLALKSDGTVWAWGYNEYGQLGGGSTSHFTTTPGQVSNLTGVVAVAGGNAHSLALKLDGTVWAWGANFSGQLGIGTSENYYTIPVQVSNLTGVIAIAAGRGHSLALKSDGTVWAWGDNRYGQLGNGSSGIGDYRATPAQVSGLTGVVAVAGGGNHSLALKSDGTVWAWGDNEAGQLGNGSSWGGNYSPWPVQVSGLTGVVAVAGGVDHSLALKSDGTVWAWGYNGYGQLGDGTNTSHTTPVQVSNLSGVIGVAARYGSYSLALKPDGTVWAWGAFGGSTSTTPVQVSGLTRIVALAAGSNLLSVQLMKLDLMSTGVSGSATTLSGSSITISDTAYNAGPDASREFYVGFYLSNDATITTSDTFLGYRTVSSLAAGESSSGSTTVTLHTGIPSGTYYIGAIADYLGLVGETDEGNNSLIGNAITITLPDLTITSFSGPESAMPGDSITVSNAVQNGGTAEAGTFTVGFYLSTDSTITAADILLGSRTISSLATGASDTASTVVTIPQMVLAGTYYLGVVVDRGNALAEENEDNNAITSMIPITVRSYSDLNVWNWGEYKLPVTTTPEQVSGLTNIIAVAAGRQGGPGGYYSGGYYYCGGDGHSLALKSDGTVLAWGRNDFGQLGIGSTSECSWYLPVQVNNVSDAVAVAGGGYYSLALKSDGTVWAWGRNDLGQLGDGTGIHRSTPVQVSNLTGVVAIAGGYYHSIALKSDGTVWAWGRNDFGQLGDGTQTNRSTPVQVSNLTGVVTIAGGGHHSFALKSDGTAWAWGRNSSGQLGDGTQTNRSTPVQVSNLTGVVAVAGGGGHSLALKSDGTVWAWGYNGYGQLGDGTQTDYSTPVQVSNLTGVVTIAGGGHHSFALKSDGTAWAWGRNSSGQLGDGTQTNRSTPVQVSNLTGVVAVAGGGGHSLAVKLINPDLTPTAVSGPDAAPLGTSITVSDTVSNAGQYQAGEFLVGLYLSADSAITTSDTFLGYRTVSSLSAGASSSGNTTVTIPANISVGTYYIGTIADYSNLVRESAEGNNALAGNTITVTAPDLITTSVLGPSTAATGRSITISDTVKNQNAVNAGGFYVGFYLSTDAVITTDDIYIGTRYISALSAGASDSSNTSVTIPAGVAAGTYYLGVIADYSSIVPESNETNNSKAGNTIIISGQDLIMTAVSGPTSAVAGSSIAISNTVKNQGNTNAGAFRVGLYLSTDATITTADTFLGSRSLSSLGKGSSSSASTTVTIPVGTAVGTYYLGAIADDLKQAAETNETNNAKAGNTIGIGPDLVPTALTASISGSNLVINDSVKNQGSQATTVTFDVGFYLSTNTTFDVTDTFICKRSVSGLAAGASNPTSGTVQTTCPITTDVTPGAYYILAFDDSGNTVGESNEANNTRATTSTLNIGPDLTPIAVSVTKSGSTLTLTDSAKNQGNVAIPTTTTFDISFYLSTNTTFDASDKFICKRSVSGLTAGTTNSTTISCPAPTGVSGTFYVIVLDDSGNIVTESMENNNTKFTSKTITLP